MLNFPLIAYFEKAVFLIGKRLFHLNAIDKEDIQVKSSFFILSNA